MSQVTSGRQFENFPPLKGVYGEQSSICDVFSAGNGTFTPTAATIYLCKCPIPYGLQAASAIEFVLTTSGTGATAISNAQCGIYNSSGTLLGSSAAADMAAGGASAIDEATPGRISVALAAESGQSLTVPGGSTAFVWAAIHIGVQASTSAVVKGGSNNATNLGLTAANARFGTYTGHASNNLTTIGALTPSSITLANNWLWLAIR